MKKKRLKIIGKLSCVILLASVIISTLVVPSFAWQNTNHYLAGQWYRGQNSYSLAPLNSLYYEYYTDLYNSTVNYSINCPNIITSEGKNNWGGSGYPLTATYEEQFGNGGRGRVYTRSWDSFSNMSGFNRLIDLPSENIITVENNDNVSVYPGLKADEVWVDNSKPGTNIDAISYVVKADQNTGDSVNLNLYTDSFISTQRFSRNLLTYQWSSPNIESTSVNIKYAFVYADQDGILHNARGGFSMAGRNSGSTTIGGVSYETDSVGILETILTYEEEEKGAYGLDRESNQMIEWTSVQVYTFSDSDMPVVQSAITIPYIRPYSQPLIDSANAGDRTYFSGWYSTIKPYQSTIWYALFEHVAPDAAPDLELGPLGTSIGDAVTGVLNTEIFPDISLWTLLLIPFSLGLVFTFIKFFAGG